MNNDAVGRVMTVQGPVDPNQLGFTLMHEHLFTRFWQASYRFDLAGMPEDPQYVLEELDAFHQLGGRAVVDVTPTGLNRDPLALRDASARSGLHLVMGVGWYREYYLPAAAEIDKRSVSSLSEELVHEIERGVGDTGVRPGIVGEIGTEKPWMSPAEERVHRAAGRAAAATGLAVMTHSFASDIGLWQLDVLEEEGLDPRRVVIGHADTYRLRDYHRGLLERGASIEFDTLCWYRPTLFEQALDMIADYLEEGYGPQLLVSLDNCKAEHLRAFGGTGFSAVHELVIPGLERRGMGQGAVRAIWEDNPRTILTRNA